MIVLGVDSTGKTASTAIVRDGVLVYENYLAAGLTHSESLVALCDAVLKDLELAFCIFLCCCCKDINCNALFLCFFLNTCLHLCPEVV